MSGRMQLLLTLTMTSVCLLPAMRVLPCTETRRGPTFPTQYFLCVRPRPSATLSTLLDGIQHKYKDTAECRVGRFGLVLAAWASHALQ